MNSKNYFKKIPKIIKNGNTKQLKKYINKISIYDPMISPHSLSEFGIENYSLIFNNKSKLSFLHIAILTNKIRILKIFIEKHKKSKSIKEKNYLNLPILKLDFIRPIMLYLLITKNPDKKVVNLLMHEQCDINLDIFYYPNLDNLKEKKSKFIFFITEQIKKSFVSSGCSVFEISNHRIQYPPKKFLYMQQVSLFNCFNNIILYSNIDLTLKDYKEKTLLKLLINKRNISFWSILHPLTIYKLLREILIQEPKLTKEILKYMIKKLQFDTKILVSSLIKDDLYLTYSKLPIDNNLKLLIKKYTCANCGISKYCGRSKKCKKCLNIYPININDCYVCNSNDYNIAFLFKICSDCLPNECKGFIAKDSYNNYSQCDVCKRVKDCYFLNKKGLELGKSLKKCKHNEYNICSYKYCSKRCQKYDWKYRKKEHLKSLNLKK